MVPKTRVVVAAVIINLLFNDQLLLVEDSVDCCLVEDMFNNRQYFFFFLRLRKERDGCSPRNNLHDPRHTLPLYLFHVHRTCSGNEPSVRVHRIGGSLAQLQEMRPRSQRDGNGDSCNPRSRQCQNGQTDDERLRNSTHVSSRRRAYLPRLQGSAKNGDSIETTTPSKTKVNDRLYRS